MQYCRALKFEDRPDYSFIKKLFTERMEREHMEFDLLYDWMELEGKKQENGNGTSKSRSIKTAKPGTSISLIIKTGEEFKRQPSSFKATDEPIPEQASKEEDTRYLLPEGEEPVEEKKQEDVKEETKRKVEDVFKQLQEISRPDLANSKGGPTLRDALNAVGIFLYENHLASRGTEEKESSEI